MVIGPSTTQHPRVSDFWFEQRRDSAPSWLPTFIAGWWTRWTRISPKRRIAMRRGGAMVVPFESEAEMYQMLDALDRAEEGAA